MPCLQTQGECMQKVCTTVLWNTLSVGSRRVCWLDMLCMKPRELVQALQYAVSVLRISVSQRQSVT